MIRRVSFFIFFVLFVKLSFSQPTNTLKGKIITDLGDSPVDNCSVFINSTSNGTVTNAKGEFSLSDIPSGKFELIVSSIGYETYVYPFLGSDLPLELNIRLKQKPTELSAVTVEPFEKDGWETWGQTFIDNFIGTTTNARRCTIKNKETIHFRFSKKNNRLTVFADQPLIVENKALGYIIKFQLEEFTANFDSHTNVYLGYPLFGDMPAKSKMLQTALTDNRRKAYEGSIMHFIRSLYNNELQPANQFNQAGFEVRRQIKLPNTEKIRIMSIYKQGNGIGLMHDSVKYYKKVLQQPDSLLYNRVLNSTDIVNTKDDQVKTLFLQVNFQSLLGEK